MSFLTARLYPVIDLNIPLHVVSFSLSNLFKSGIKRKHTKITLKKQFSQIPLFLSLPLPLSLAFIPIMHKLLNPNPIQQPSPKTPNPPPTPKKSPIPSQLLPRLPHSIHTPSPIHHRSPNIKNLQPLIQSIQNFQALPPN